MRVFLILAAWALLCSALSPETSPSAATARAIARLEAAVSPSLAARRLLAATGRVPRLESRNSGLPEAIAARPGAEPAIVFDPARLPDLAESDAAVLFILALARAELGFPVPTVEAEQAAWQKTVIFCAELGAEDPRGFGKILARAAREQGERFTALKNSMIPVRTPWAATEIPVLALPEGALARAGLLLVLFERDPQDFYWAVEAGSPWPSESARLSELEDLFALRAGDIAALSAAPQGPYASLGAHRYRGALVRAAYRLRGTGEIERLRESLEAYDSVGLLAVKPAINRWRRAIDR